MKKDITNQKFGGLLPRRLFGQYREKAASGDVNANAAGKKKFLPLIC